MQQEIIVSQDDINNINILPVENQTINLNNVINDNINISEEQNQNINIKQEDNQTIYIDDEGVAYNITDVLVNGVSVVSNNIAYVVVPTKLSELENNVGFITSEIDPTVPLYIKQITLSDISNWNNKQDLLVSGTNIKTINNTSLLGSGNIDINPSYTAGTGINITGATISNMITSYNDLTDLPTIPEYTGDLINNSNFVSNNELAEVAFNGSYNALSDTPIIPDSTSELTNDSGFIDKNVNDLTYYTLSSSLSTIATSGNYNDLSNKPTIPIVNNATLTIQKNGSTIDTFTANSNTNTTVNVTVPTSTNELTNNSGFITSSDLPQDSGWINVTIETGTWTTAKVRKIGKIVEFYAYGTSIPGNGGIQYFTIPSGYRPSNDLQTYGYNGWVNYPTIARWYILTNGKVGIEWCLSLTNGSQVNENTWKRIHVTYFTD